MPSRAPKPLIERLLEHLELNDNGCWNSNLKAETNGYVRMMLGRKGDGRDSVHRVAWRLFRGPIPDGLFVCHRCDNPACFNPDHLFLGTQKDNMADMRAKGRERYNEKLAWWDVRDIQSDDRTAAEIAAFYGICTGTVYQIKQRRYARLHRGRMPHTAAPAGELMRP